MSLTQKQAPLYSCIAWLLQLYVVSNETKFLFVSILASSRHSVSQGAAQKTAGEKIEKAWREEARRPSLPFAALFFNFFARCFPYLTERLEEATAKCMQHFIPVAHFCRSFDILLQDGQMCMHNNIFGKMHVIGRGGQDMTLYEPSALETNLTELHFLIAIRWSWITYSGRLFWCLPSLDQDEDHSMRNKIKRARKFSSPYAESSERKKRKGH